MSYTLDTETAREYLAEYDECKAGGTVYTLVTSVARSGMSRRIKVYVMHTDQRTGKAYPANITHLVAAVLGYSRNDDGMLVRGCGMDMGFHVVYSLSRTLHKDADTSGASHPDPGYLLTQRWL